MSGSELAGGVLFHLGPLAITDTVATTWGVMLFLAIAARLLTYRLAPRPSRRQTIAEGVVAVVERAIGEAVPAGAVRRVLPFVASLWIFVLAANLAGLIPGVHAPTRDLSATAALAALVFASTHWYGIRARGLRAYLRHYTKPSPILLPFHIISELTRTLALAIRLFGNIMSLEMAALLVLLIAGFLVPVPLLMLHVIEAVVQAYIFGVLALIYIGGAIEPGETDEAEPSRAVSPAAAGAENSNDKEES
ncbi:MAG: F0F1 ATP synthase subunit A [Candidatus Accumulibacter sp.]|uniref:F0F1 ATP synthase subunit A n=1 Tax=Accumulibacter sp. TaxID=2053492 RepID=UPI0019F1915B|nr:F0F1 ATP synthase subunit A [Accumulibacter sp.]MBE2259824.1 F0F1 ATP synthase subunit A [Paracoccaceae bacterium]MCB1942012.1 F0F1 ATP synthase subunit A [Accumulibacter sp.]MCP5249109.1 F0F1 ATP synthase subunit A [Accumulibacter sp.]